MPKSEKAVLAGASLPLELKPEPEPLEPVYATAGAPPDTADNAQWRGEVFLTCFHIPQSLQCVCGGGGGGGGFMRGLFRV